VGKSGFSERKRATLELIADFLDAQVDEAKYSHPTLQTIINEIKSDSITPQELRVIKSLS